MNRTIASVRPATAEEWDTIWRDCDYATYFHSREWAEIWETYTEGQLRPDPKLVQFSDGQQALLPLSVQKQFRGITKCYISSPGGTFGGWISARQLNLKNIDQLTFFWFKKLGSISWRVNPYSEFASAHILDSNEADVTHTLKLTDGFDAVCKRWTKGHLSAARKANREGVSVKLAASLDDWLAYYQTYEDSLRRWGNTESDRYHWAFFENIFHRSSPNVKLWLALCQDNVIAGALCFYAKHHVVYWHGAALEAYFHLRPVNFLLYEAIRDACSHQFTWFDFNPSGGLEGVKAFKKSFGTETLQCPSIESNTRLVLLLQKSCSLLKGLH